MVRVSHTPRHTCYRSLSTRPAMERSTVRAEGDDDMLSGWELSQLSHRDVSTMLKQRQSL